MAPRAMESLKSALIDSRVTPFVATERRVLPPALGRCHVRDFRPQLAGRGARASASNHSIGLEFRWRLRMVETGVEAL